MTERPFATLTEMVVDYFVSKAAKRSSTKTNKSEEKRASRSKRKGERKKKSTEDSMDLGVVQGVGMASQSSMSKTNIRTLADLSLTDTGKPNTSAPFTKPKSLARSQNSKTSKDQTQSHEDVVVKSDLVLEDLDLEDISDTEFDNGDPSFDVLGKSFSAPSRQRHFPYQAIAIDESRSIRELLFGKVDDPTSLGRFHDPWLKQVCDILTPF